MSVAANCTDQIAALLVASGEFGQKVFAVYSEEDLMDKAKLVKYPAVGVMYEGLRADGGDPSKQGMSAELQVAIAVLLDGKSYGIDTKNEATRILDVCRKAIRLQRAPTGHKWEFVQEVPMGLVHNLSLYVQRWQTKAILTSG